MVLDSVDEEKIAELKKSGEITNKEENNMGMVVR